MGKSIDLETVKLVREMIGTNPPPTPPSQDRDSFASFTGGLRQNWIFLIAAVAVFMWLNTHITNTEAIDQRQDTAITANAAAISKLTSTLEAYTANQNTSNNDVIRRLDNLQKDVDIIKGK